MTLEKTIPIDQELVNIFGVNDQNLNYLKSLFPNLEINVRGNVVYINGSSKDTQEATRILDEMIIMGSKNETIEIPDLELIAKIKNSEKLENSKVSQLNVIDNKFIKVKNLNQFKYLETIDNSTITFGIGPAGTGKTFLAVASAVKMYSENKIKKIVLTRPAVEAGERLGYLPGDLSQKIDPYLVPLFDSLEYFFGNETLQYLIDKRNIEIVPLAYMQEVLFQYFFYQLNIAGFHFQKNIQENQRGELDKDLFFEKGHLEDILIFHQLQQRVVLRQFF